MALFRCFINPINIITPILRANFKENIFVCALYEMYEGSAEKALPTPPNDSSKRDMDEQ